MNLLKAQIIKLNIKFISFLSLMLLLTSYGYGQTYVFIEAVDEYNGEQVEVEFRAESIKTGRSHVIKTEDGRQYFILPEGDEVRVKSVIDGYYPKEETIKAEDIASDEYEIKLNIQKRPTALLNLKAKATDSGRLEPASFELYFEGRMVGRGNTTKNAKNYSITLNQAGTYQLKTVAEGFSELNTTFDIEIGSPAVRTDKEISLKRLAEEVAVKFVDEQSGNTIDAEVVIREQNSSDKLYDDNTEDGIVNFKFENEKRYIIVAKSYSHQRFEKIVEGGLDEDFTVQMKPVSIVTILVQDKLTEKEISSDIKVISPSGKQVAFMAETNNSFIPVELGDYKITVNSGVYISKTGTVTINSFDVGKMERNFKLEKASNEYKIKVVDHYSKTILKNVEFRVFGPGGQKVEDVNINETGEWVFKTDPTKKYFIEVSANSYQDYTKALKEVKSFDVDLVWLPELTYAYFLLEHNTQNVIEGAVLNILSSSGQSVFVHNTNANGKFIAKLNNDEAYSYFVNAKGYKSEVAAISSRSSNEKELYLAKLDSDLYTFNTYDYLTKEPINASLKYFSGTKELDLIKEEHNVIKAEFSLSSSYKVEAKLKGYRTFNKPITQSMLRGNLIDIPMEKEFYRVEFRIENLVSKEELLAMKFRILTGKRVRIPEQFSSKTKLYEANLNGVNLYTLEIEKDGYELYTKDFYVSDLLESGMLMSVKLKEEIPEPIPEVVAATPVLEKPKAKVETEVPEPIKEIEAPTVIAKKSEPKVPTKKEAELIPASKEEMAKEFAKEESKGKRYLLDQVFFEQSSYFIKDDEIEQLNELVETLKGNDRLIVEIVGYTDNLGDPRLNLGLSKNRAKAVANYLFYKGANPDRIQSTGFGEEQAVAQNDSEENRAKNRRVELVLVEN